MAVAQPLSTRRSSDARCAASRRVEAPSFVSTAATWCSAVRCETISRSAISALVRPCGDQREHLELARGEAGRVGARRLARSPRNAHPELAHPHGDPPGERLRAEPARDPDRLGQSALVAGQRQHERALVRPAELPECVRAPRASRAAPSPRTGRRPASRARSRPPPPQPTPPAAPRTGRAARRAPASARQAPRTARAAPARRPSAPAPSRARGRVRSAAARRRARRARPAPPRARARPGPPCAPRARPGPSSRAAGRW